MAERNFQSQAKASETTGHGKTVGHGVKPDAGRLSAGRTAERNATESGVTAGETAPSPVEIISRHSRQIGGVTVNFTVGRIGQRSVRHSASSERS